MNYVLEWDVALYCLKRYGKLSMFTSYLFITNNKIPVHSKLYNFFECCPKIDIQLSAKCLTKQNIFVSFNILLILK